MGQLSNIPSEPRLTALVVEKADSNPSKDPLLPLLYLVLPQTTKLREATAVTCDTIGFLLVAVFHSVHPAIIKHVEHRKLL